MHRFALYNIFLLFALLIFVMSCRQQQEPENTLLARVDDKQLFRSDLEKLMPHNLSKTDSAAFAAKIINDWVYQQLFYNEAKANISDTAEIYEKLENYRMSLYTYHFEQQLQARKLDTVVKTDEIHEYYSQYLHQFALSQPVIKLHAIIFDVRVFDYTDVMKTMRDTESDDIEELFEFCEKAGLNIVYIDKWMKLNEFYRYFPCEANVAPEVLEINEMYECFDDSLRYIIKIDDLLPVGTNPPVEVLYDDIRKTILQKRARDFMAMYRKQLYIKAEGSGRVYIKK